MNKRFRNLAKGLSLTSMLFVFQACYGSPQDMDSDVHISGVVLSDTTENPIQNIKVKLINKDSGMIQSQQTDTNGEFSIYTDPSNSYELNFTDVDSTENNIYIEKDTIISNVGENVYLKISLEKQ